MLQLEPQCRRRARGGTVREAGAVCEGEVIWWVEALEGTPNGVGGGGGRLVGVGDP